MSRAQIFDYEVIAQAYASTEGRSHRQRALKVAEQFKCSFPTVERAIRGLPGGASTGGPTPLGINNAIVPKIDDRAVIEKRTRFPSTVRTAELEEGAEPILKEGKHQAKIGNRITVGPWNGYPIYTLTLEERKTCPVSCRHFASCYGNNMHLARRWALGPELEARLPLEVAALHLKHPRGFAIRLHTLGDFYSVQYVRMWKRLLKIHPPLHCFGYSARTEDSIAYELALLVREYWSDMRHHPRFAIRFSNYDCGVRSTISLESPVQKPPRTFICPEQWVPSGEKKKSCADCGLCWGAINRVAFVQH